MRTSKFLMMMLCCAVGMWAADPWLGMWKVNVAKSQFDPGPPIKSRVHTLEMVGEQYKSTIESVNAEGVSGKSVWIGKADGREYPVESSTAKLTVARRNVSPTVVETTTKIDGKPYYTTRTVLAKDGKWFTTTIKGTRDGKAFHNVIVYEKQ